MLNSRYLRTRVIALGVIFALIAITATTVGTGAQTAGASSPGYQIFSGTVADFYNVPSPLPPGSPGTLIRVQPVGTNATSTTLRIMYHSVDGAGHDRAVTGTLTYPNAAPPTGGWPVMSIANGTVGLAPKCALSRAGNPAFDFGINGVAVDSDYIGEGPTGQLQAYLSRDSEGHSVIDAVRAARNYAGAHAGSEFVVLGGSQGGHGALSANELAATYAPELDLAGTVALAPAAMFDRTYGPLDEIVTRVVMAMGLLGLSTEHPNIDIADYASPAAMSAFQVMHTECLDPITSAVLSVKGDFWTHDPRVTEPARSIMLANDVGKVRAPSPVLLLQGTADPIVNPLRTDDLFARMCGVGQVTDYRKVPGADHQTVGTLAIDQIESWLQDRLQGLAAADTCSKAPPSTNSSTTSTTAPASTTSVVPTTTSATGVVPVATKPGSPDTQPATTGEKNDGTLPTTGAPIVPLGSVALLCLCCGLVLWAVARRSRGSTG